MIFSWKIDAGTANPYKTYRKRTHFTRLIAHSLKNWNTFQNQNCHSYIHVQYLYSTQNQRLMIAILTTSSKRFVKSCLQHIITLYLKVVFMHWNQPGPLLEFVQRKTKIGLIENKLVNFSFELHLYNTQLYILKYT